MGSEQRDMNNESASDYAKFNGVNFPQWKHFIDAVDQLKLWINEELSTIMLLSSLPLEYEVLLSQETTCQNWKLSESK